METTKLLQDITYYTRIIEERKKQNRYETQRPMYNQPTNTWNHRFPRFDGHTKYKFVKKQETITKSSNVLHVEAAVTAKLPRAKATTVLINPHFKQTVHINPNFKQPLTIVSKKPTSIHVNPLIINQLKADFPQHIPQSNMRVPNPHPPIAPEELQQQNLNLLSKLKSGEYTQPHNPSRIRRTSVRSKYTIIRSSNKTSTITSPLKKISIPKSKYIIDRRVSSKKKILTPRRASIGNKLVWCRIATPRKPQALKRLSTSNSKNIQAVMYKKLKNRRHLHTTTTFKDEACHVVSIRGQKFVMNAHGKTLKRIAFKNRTTNEIGTKKWKLRSPSNGITKSSTRLQSFRTNLNTSKMRKNNIPCPFFCRYGKCSSYEKGSCRRVHDSKLIAVCKKFLQGECLIKDCTLSHNVTLEKMPTCKFYLDGFCSREHCPYLHVKLNDKTEICRQFLQGFCEAAEKCEKRHILKCPDMERDGECCKIKCPYPHKTAVVGKKHPNYLKPIITSINSNHICKKNGHKEKETAQFVENCRYFLGESEIDNSPNINNNPEKKTELIIPKIPLQLDVFPDFIPFS